jgi:hypothetical protein
MPTFIDLTDQKFNRLTVLSLSEKRTVNGGRIWYCLCDCGTQREVRSDGLRSGQTKSCGCHKIDLMRARATHAACGTPEYSSWQAMKARCNNPNASKYYMYGARGVTVCPSWITSFENFYADMGDRPAKDYSIERLDGSLGYSKENCVWADKTTQANDTRLNRPMTYLGETLNLSQWARKFNIPVTTLLNRVDTRNMTLEEAFTFKPFQRVKH